MRPPNVIGNIPPIDRGQIASVGKLRRCPQCQHVELDGIDYLAGVTSNGVARDGDVDSDYGDLAGFIRVSQFTDWIESVTGIVAMQLIADLPGDYNGNGVVDAADYAVWRDAMTAGSTSLANDPTPGTVDESDFLYWRDHFGEVLGSGAGEAASAAGELVPEPGTGTLAAMLIACGLCLRAWRSNRFSQAIPAP